MKGPIRTSTSQRSAESRRPIMALLDLLGKRWTLRIIWELRDTPLNARALRSRCDNASPTVLNARLKELREADLVELVAGAGYSLTGRGKELLLAFEPLYAFAEGHGFRQSPQ